MAFQRIDVPGPEAPEGPEPLMEVDAWLAPFRRFWAAHVDALERHLDRMEKSPPTKRKKR